MTGDHFKAHVSDGMVGSVPEEVHCDSPHCITELVIYNVQLREIVRG